MVVAAAAVPQRRHLEPKSPCSSSCSTIAQRKTANWQAAILGVVQGLTEFLPPWLSLVMTMDTTIQTRKKVTGGCDSSSDVSFQYFPGLLRRSLGSTTSVPSLGSTTAIKTRKLAFELSHLTQQQQHLKPAEEQNIILVIAVDDEFLYH
jgi:hypothetical protein